MAIVPLYSVFIERISVAHGVMLCVINSQYPMFSTIYMYPLKRPETFWYINYLTRIS